MAVAAHSISLFHNDSIGSTCMRLGFTSDEKFQKRRMVDFQVVVKFCPGNRKSRYSQFSSCNRNSSGFGSNWPSLVSIRTEKAFSKRGTRSSETGVITAILEEMLSVIRNWSGSHFTKLAGLLVCALMVIPSANAVNALKTCSCLLKECRVELAKCIANPSCAANVACLQTCNNRPDETECQIKCGDLFENSVVDEFNECAVSCP